MRAELMAALAVVGGAAAAVGVSACGSSSGGAKSASSAVVSTPSTAATAPAPPKPTTIKVSVNGTTVTIRLAKVGFGYCRANPRTCAGIKSTQFKYLTQNQR